LSDEKLVIPHQKMLERKFVLQPLFEINPNWMHPVLKKNVEYFLKNIDNNKDIVIKLKI
jgi:7,8-dihydro-6-hydroxymethylpterin-pyrophosphokinase